MSGLKIRKVAGALGAEISGVDLSADLPDAVIEEIRPLVQPMLIDLPELWTTLVNRLLVWVKV